MRDLKRNLMLLFFPVIGILLAGFFISCSQPEAIARSDKQHSYEVREGKRLFLHYCSPCHGEDADGAGRYFPSMMKPQPTDFLNSDYLQKTKKEIIFQAIKFGSQSLDKSSYSPPYGLTLRDEEIRNILAFLESLIR